MLQPGENTGPAWGLGGDTVIGDDAVIGGNSFLIDSVGKGARVTAGKKADS